VLGRGADRGADHVPDRLHHLAAGIFHFRKFGADIFVVDMLGVLVLREIGVLLVRSWWRPLGLGLYAELGSMKMREEDRRAAHHGF